MLTHINQKQQPTMVDVSEKDVSFRVAKAQAIVFLPREILTLLKEGEILSKKGPVFQTSIIAGTMAAKRTFEIIPFCHPISIEKCNIDISLNNNNEVLVLCEVAVHHKTGVEMEALFGASAAALTIYDMCKAISHEIVVKDVRLLEKKGGKSG